MNKQWTKLWWYVKVSTVFRAETNFRRQILTFKVDLQWWIQGGGGEAQEARAPLFLGKYFKKSPKLDTIYKKNLARKPPKPRAPPFFRILDPPLEGRSIKLWYQWKGSKWIKNIVVQAIHNQGMLAQVWLYFGLVV